MSNCRCGANQSAMSHNMASECRKGSAKSHYVICDNVMGSSFYVTRKTRLIQKSFQPPHTCAADASNLLNVFINLTAKRLG